MPDDRDHLDQWLGEPVRPMSPPPGTFELIRKRARRRKLRQAAVSAAGVAAVIAIGVSVPRLLTPVFNTRPVAGSSNTPPSQRTEGPSQPTAVKSSTPAATPPASPPAAPPNFQVSSVTFVGSQTGFVIGQAGTAGQCTGPNPADCTSIARTDNAGQSWYGVPAPVTGSPHGASGVGGIRFLNTEVGWAFGPQLWVTYDGGQGVGGTGWHRVSTGGMQVTDLETVNGRAFAVWAHCRPTGTEVGASCTSYSLYSAPAVPGGRWSPVPGLTGLTPPSGGGSASLLLTGTRGYLLAPNGELYSGPVSGTAGWRPVTGADGSPAALPCTPGSPMANGLPSQAFLGSTDTAAHLVLVCPATGTAAVYASTDGGATWRNASTITTPDGITSVSGILTGGVVVATAGGIEVSASPSGPWRTARGTTSAAGGFTYVGMTEPNQGVAVAADTSLHALWFTTDAGRAWSPSQIP